MALFQAIFLQLVSRSSRHPGRTGDGIGGAPAD